MITVMDYKRGCGTRKKGGIYLTASKLGAPCGKLPIVLGEVCRVTYKDVLDKLGLIEMHTTEKAILEQDLGFGCGQLVWNTKVDGEVVKASRSYRKLENPAPLFNAQPCEAEEIYGRDNVCEICPLREWPANEPLLLDWVGVRHYPTADHFEKEAHFIGVSRRIRHLPEWFEVGKTWVALAHRHCVPLSEEEATEHVEFLPAIFKMFRPTQVEVVCDGTETEEELAEYKAQGLTPVSIKYMGEHPELKED